MSLTTQDLVKIGKAIKPIVRAELGNEVKNLKSSLIAEVKMTRIEIVSTISELENRIKDIELNQNTDHELLTFLREDVKKLQKSLSRTINFFDKSNVSTRKQVNKTRNELGLKEVEFAY